MRIAIVTNNAFPDKFGGHERYSWELAHSLADEGHEVTLVAKRKDRDAPRRERTAGGVHVVRHRMPSKRNPLFAPLYFAYTTAAVLRRARRTAAETESLHVHFFTPALPLALLRRPYAYTFQAPVWRELISERQGSYFLPFQSLAQRMVRATERLVLRRATVIVTLSEYMLGEVRALDPDAAARTIVIPGGLSDVHFTPADEHAPDVPADPPVELAVQAPGAAPVPDPPPLIFTVRRLTPRTGVDVLVRAMALIRREHPDARCVVAGGGGMHTEISELIDELDLEQSVELAGEVTEAQLVGFYRAADVVVVPTVTLEGFGLTTAEALACGTPVVGTSAGATPELLLDLDPELVVEPGDAEALAEAINGLLSDDARRGALADRARPHAVPRWSWSTVVERHAEVYARLR